MSKKATFRYAVVSTEQFSNHRFYVSGKWTTLSSVNIEGHACKDQYGRRTHLFWHSMACARTDKRSHLAGSCAVLVCWLLTHAHKIRFYRVLIKTRGTSGTAKRISNKSSNDSHRGGIATGWQQIHSHIRNRKYHKLLKLMIKECRNMDKPSKHTPLLGINM
jgi:hypothetical protein